MLLPLTGPPCCCLQQGNEAALADQVRQQFRMNMHETDEGKVGAASACALGGKLCLHRHAGDTARLLFAACTADSATQGGVSSACAACLAAAAACPSFDNQGVMTVSRGAQLTLKLTVARMCACRAMRALSNVYFQEAERLARVRDALGCACVPAALRACA